MSTITWRNAQSGEWSSASNWDWGIVPSAADEALFNLAGSYVVTIDSAATAQSLVFNALGATLQETTGSLTVAFDLIVDAGEVSLDGTNSIGMVTIDNG